MAGNVRTRSGRTDLLAYTYYKIYNDLRTHRLISLQPKSILTHLFLNKKSKIEKMPLLHNIGNR